MQNTVIVTPILMTPKGCFVQAASDGYILPSRQVEGSDLPILTAIKLLKDAFPSSDFTWWQSRLEKTYLYVESVKDARCWTHVLAFRLSDVDVDTALPVLWNSGLFLGSTDEFSDSDFVVNSQHDYITNLLECGFDTETVETAAAE